MHAPYQTNQRTGPTSAEAARHPYIPPPPPPSTSATLTQNHGIPIPPPPPRPPPNQSHGGVVHLPAGASTNSQYAWPSGYARQTFAQQQYMSGQHATYNPNAYYSYQSASTPIPVAASQDNQPLTSATYIPGGESFGPGVGIPPLNPGQIQYQPQRPIAEQQHTFYHGENIDYPPVGDPLRSGPTSGPTSDINVQLLHEVSRSPENNTSRYYMQKHGTSSDINSSTSPHNQTYRPPDGLINTPSTPQDSGFQWPLDRVLSWLVSNSFSGDWQQTFQVLNLHGSQFLELGRGHGGRGNVGLMHSKIFPQLAKECTQSGSGWDQGREREEGKRLRRLIRSIVDITPSSNTKFGQRGPGNASGQDTITDSNLHDGHSSTPTTAGGGDDSPGQQMGFNQTKNVSTAPASQLRFSPQKESSQTPFESTSQETMNRNAYSEAILKGVGEESSTRRHSPTGPREALSNNAFSAGPRSESSRLPFESSPQQSPSLGQPRVPSIGTNGASSSISYGRHGHKRGVSSDSSYSGFTQDGRKHGQDGSRTNTTDGSVRSSANEPPTSAKESKGFLNKFIRGRPKKDDPHPSPDELHLESPTSPIAFRQLPINGPYVRLNVNSSETSLDRPPSRAAQGDADKSGRTASRARQGSAMVKKFVLVTPDRWNFRLIDVSEVHSADVWRSVLCYELDLSDTKDLAIYLTNPGQFEHNESLSDSQIMQFLQKADGGASLKLFVKSPFHAPQHSAVIPLENSPEAFTPGILKEKGDGQENPRSSQDSSRSMFDGRVDRSADPEFKDSERKTSLQVASEEHRREVERKSKANRKNRLRNPSPIDPNSTIASGSGYKKRDVIDFDTPRVSPYEPRRKPPPVPPVSKTLEKANSLSRRPSTQSRYSWTDRVEGQNKRTSDELSIEDAAERGRRIALAHSASAASNNSKMNSTAGSIASSSMSKSSSVRSAHDLRTDSSRKAIQTATSIQSSKSSGSPGSPGFMMSQGNVPFKIPDYDASRLVDDGVDSNEPSKRQGLSHPNLFKVKESEQSDSPDTSPSTVKPPKLISRMPTRKSNGPTFVFQEPSITFEKSPAKTSHDPSDDSDDGLFAIPLKGASQRKDNTSPPDAQNSQGDTSPERGTSRSERPSLTLKTSRSGKGLSVAFESPKLAPSPTYSAGDHSAGSDQTLDRSTSADRPYLESLWSAESPNENFKDFRRQSFASDVWASRPPAEALVEHLDDFFPNVDLDQPALEDQPVSPTASPGPSRNLRATRKESMESMRSDGDISTTETGFPKRMNQAHSIARRSVGLGRTKSIREVVKGAYQHPDKPAIPGLTRINTLKAGDIARRRSTKMFGAKIEQIRAPKGTKLSNLQTIPQDALPQRQLTFKWVKGQLIGKGTFGRVYLGMNTTTGELLAVKQVEVTPKLAGQDKDKMKEMVKALDQEIDTMQHLDHVNIVQYLGCERKEYSISIFLEYIPGGSVGSCLRKHGKFEEPVVSSLTRQTLSGLAYLHDEGILHRDLKADNILLDNDGTCKISDFGISKKTDNIYGNDVTNSMQGSVFWMAPEVIRSQDTGYSAKVDIWSLGCVVLEMFAGRRPWSKEEAIGAIYKLGSLNQAPPIPDDVASAISPAALSFMYDCFNVDPADRPTADTLLRAPFCFTDPNFNFLDTDLYAKIRPNFDPVVAET